MSALVRKTLLVFAVAPCPFFFLGIPCASGWPSHAFRITCGLFSTLSILAFSFPSKAGVLASLALIANETASGIISAYWCAGDREWLGLLVVESLFVVVAACMLLESRWTVACHLFYVVPISVAGYYYWDVILAHFGQGLAPHVPAARRLQDSDDDANWASAIIVCVLALILGIMAIGYLKVSHIRSVGRWVRDTMCLCCTAKPMSGTEVANFKDLMPVEYIPQDDSPRPGTARCSPWSPPTPDHQGLEAPGVALEIEIPDPAPETEGELAPVAATRAEGTVVAAQGGPLPEANEGVAGEPADASSEDEETASQHSVAASIGSSVGSWLSHYTNFMLFVNADATEVKVRMMAREANEAMFSVHTILRAKLPAQQMPGGVLCLITSFLLDAQTQDVAQQRVMRRVDRWSRRRPLRRVGHWFRRLLRRRERLEQPPGAAPPVL